MALGLRSVLEQLALFGKTSSLYSAEVVGGYLAITRTAPQVFC
jgi:hypothetical protein